MAGNSVILRQGAQWWPFLRTHSNGMWTAVVKAATRRRIDRAFDIAFESDPLAPVTRMGDWNGRQ
jgi:hypothetical protein